MVRQVCLGHRHPPVSKAVGLSELSESGILSLELSRVGGFVETQDLDRQALLFPCSVHQHQSSGSCFSKVRV